MAMVILTEDGKPVSFRINFVETSSLGCFVSFMCNVEAVLQISEIIFIKALQSPDPFDLPHVLQ